MLTNVTEALYGEIGMRELDRRALALPGLGEGGLMERAGAALLDFVREHYPGVCRLGVLCGPGNNGGDGFVMARLAREEGYKVTLHGPEQVADVSPTPGAGDGQRARAAWLASGGSIRPLLDFAPADAELWVDCLFGIGLRRPLSGAYAFVVERLNTTRTPVLAADVPSGINIDSGAVLGVAVRATATLSFLADKLGLHTGAAVDHAGVVHVNDLQIPVGLLDDLPILARRLDAGAAAGLRPVRRPGAHKGEVGHVLVVGGVPEYAGAARLCAIAALRAGAGRVTLATHPDHAVWGNINQPELMVRALQRGGDLRPLLERVNVVAVGPGLGQDAWSRGLWPVLADWSGSLVVDADALNLLAQAPRRRDDWVLTPHPGEAARLLATSAAAIEADRVAAVRALHERYGGVIILKGAGTLVMHSVSEPLICVTGGHPGMASPGMGDALTGMIAALLGQGMGRNSAAATAVAWHAAAAQLAAQRVGGQVGIVASDVITALPACAT